MILIIIHNMIH